MTLVAFSLALATLILQGFTLAPLIRALGLDRIEDRETDISRARRALFAVGLAELEHRDTRDDLTLRALYELRTGADDAARAQSRLQVYRDLGLGVVGAQRAHLLRLRNEEKIGVKGFYLLQEEIDWRELTLLPESERRIDET